MQSKATVIAKHPKIIQIEIKTEIIICVIKI